MFQNSSQLLVYKASAGSGKTYVLTKEYLKLLFQNPTNYRHILAVTFTNKACGEMKERIVAALYDLTSDSPKNEQYVVEIAAEFGLTVHEIQIKAKNILHEILHNYSFFYVETIDSFFQRVVRNFAKELGLNSYYGLELDSSKVIHAAIQNMFLHLQENPELQAWLVNFSEQKIDEGKSRDIFTIVERASKVLVSEEYMGKSADFIPLQTILDFFVTLEHIVLEFTKDVTDCNNKILQILAQYEIEVTDFTGGSRTPFKFFTKVANGEFEVPTVKHIELFLDPDSWFAKKASKSHILPQLVASQMPQLMHQLIELITHQRGVQFRTATEIISNKYTIGVLQAVQSEIDAYCKEENIFLISNTNLLLRKIINESDAPFVYEKIGCFIKYMMIDEFQDTSSMQWQNFLPLLKNSISEDGSSLVVGDVKQAIYRFRSGDWSLLHSQIYNDFTTELQEKNLQYNWRSLANVITFNNVFFKRFSECLQYYYTNEMQELQVPISSEMQTCIESLYTDVAQEIPESTKQGGIVQVLQLKEMPEITIQEQRLELLTQKVIHLFSLGFKPKDIVFLVRAKKETKILVEHFTKQKEIYPQFEQAFSIVSSEALAVSNSSAVQFILAYLQWMETPKCKFSKTFLLVRYSAWVQNDVSRNQIDTMSKYEEIIGVKPIIQRNMSLFEIVENIILRFELHTKQEELAFVVEFQNLVYTYSKNNTVSITQFIEWWNENENKFYLKQEATGYMRTMTIHKSKGLQFPVVFVPFADWQYQTQNSSSLFETKNTDFSEIPLVSLSTSSKLVNTQFSQEYAKEKLQIYIDNLNLLYVAFTRAEEALYVVLPEKSAKNRISQIIQQSISGLLFDSSELEIDELDNFKLGKETDPVKVSESIEHKPETLYPVYGMRQKLLPDPEAIRFFDTLQSSNTERTYGLLMHKILEYIQTVDDVESSVQRCVLEGIVPENQMQEYIQTIREKIQNPKVLPWFSGKSKVVTEQSIITKTAEKRPDRIVIQGNQAIVIDYKFTRNKTNTYTNQVQEYVTIMSEMGFETQGFIWYVLLNEIEQVFL